MRIESIWLQNFRNHENLVVELDEKTTVVLGENGSGKTNVLEAIYVLAMGKSFRAEKVEEMVNWGAEVGRIKAVVSSPVKIEGWENTEGEEKEIKFEDKINLEAILTRGIVQDQQARSKQLLVNGVPRLLKNFMGNMRVVLFGPWDIRLIEGSPSRRREFLDGVLSQVNGEYRRSLMAYQKGVVRRNKILQALREGTAQRNQLWFWDQLLLKNGEIISKARRELIEFLNQYSGFKVQDSEEMEIVYEASAISAQRLAQYEKEEIWAGATLVGPHRDDWRVTSRLGGQLELGGGEQKRDLSVYGSRGEQRMAVLRLKLGELAFVEQECGEKPVLLLDDIFSELDEQHREVVIEAIRGCQTVMTAADDHLVEGVEGKVVRL